MSDYYPVIAQWLADQRSTATRDELYWLARTELEIELIRLDPHLTSSETMRERLALEEAIQRVEREFARPLRSVPEVPEKLMKAESLQLVSGERMCLEVHPCRGQQQQTSGAFRLPLSRTGYSPLMRFVGVVLVIGLGSTLYWQRDRITGLFVDSPVGMPHSVKRTLPPIDYYMGQISKAGTALWPK